MDIICHLANIFWGPWDKVFKTLDILETLVIHRVGELLPNDPIVLVAVWSAHRKDAFEASRFIMEDLKSKAPFWKKESLESTGQTAEKNRNAIWVKLVLI